MFGLTVKESVVEDQWLAQRWPKLSSKERQAARIMARQAHPVKSLEVLSALMPRKANAIYQGSESVRNYLQRPRQEA